VLDEFPEGEIFTIPARLDNCEIPYEKLRKLHYADQFPDWNRGVKRLLRTFGIESDIVIAKNALGKSLPKHVSTNSQIERIATTFSFLTKWGARSLDSRLHF